MTKKSLGIFILVFSFWASFSQNEIETFYYYAVYNVKESAYLDKNYKQPKVFISKVKQGECKTLDWFQNIPISNDFLDFVNEKYFAGDRELDWYARVFDTKTSAKKHRKFTKKI